MLGYRTGVDPTHDILSGRDQAVEILLKEFKLVEILGIEDIDTVISIHKLYDRSIVISDRHVVVDDERLQLLDEATLQVPRSTGLDSSIDKSFTTSHAMEVEVLWAKARNEPVRNVSTAPRIGVIGKETG